MKYPCAAILPPYIAGLLVAWGLMDTGWPPLPWLFGVALTVAGLALGWTRGRPVLLGGLVFLAGWTNLAWRVAVLAPDDLRLVVGSSAELATLRGVLAEPPTYRVTEKPGGGPPRPPAALDGAGRASDDAVEETVAYHTLAMVRVSSILISNRWRSASGVVVVTAPFRLDEVYRNGCPVAIRGAIQPPPGAAAEGLFDYRAYLRWLGIHYQLRTDTAKDWELAGAPPTVPPLVDRFFTWAQATLARGLPVEDEPLRLLWALTLGWKTALTNEVSEPFMRTGTMHIFAISGLHIVLIAGVLVSLLRVVRVPRAWCGALVIPLIWFYTAASGWQASAIRSTLMMTVIVGGWSLQRPGNLVNSLAAAGFLILLYDPRQLFQASFQLSFFVVLSMALLTPPLQVWGERWLRGDPLLPADLRPAWRRALDPPLRWLTSSLATSLGAWLGSLPIIAYYFHLITPVSLLANLIIIPLSSLALACNVGSLACGDWLPGATELFNHSAWFWMWLLVRVNHWMAGFTGGFFYLPGPSLMDFGAYYVAVFGILGGWLWASRWRRWLGLGFALYALGCGYRAFDAATSTRIDVLALSGGDAIRVSQRGGDMLLDGGDNRAVRRLTKPFLAARGVNWLDRQVLTHGDIRHYGGSAYLCQEFKIRQIVTGPARFRSTGYRALLSSLETPPGRLRTYAAGDRLGAWEVLHPRASDRFALADDSALVLRGAVRGTRVLFCSDLGSEGQSALLDRYPDLRSDIVVSGIPARGEPLSEDLLERVHPRLLILSDAYTPANEQAKSELRERLEKRGVPVIHTSDHGSVTVELRSRGWTARTMSGLRMAGTPSAATLAPP